MIKIDHNPKNCVHVVLSVGEILRRTGGQAIHVTPTVVDLQKVFKHFVFFNTYYKVGVVNEKSKYPDHYLFTFLLLSCEN